MRGLHALRHPLVSTSLKNAGISFQPYQKQPILLAHSKIENKPFSALKCAVAVELDFDLIAPQYQGLKASRVHHSCHSHRAEEGIWMSSLRKSLGRHLDIPNEPQTSFRLVVDGHILRVSCTLRQPHGLHLPPERHRLEPSTRQCDSTL
jgi:hypothetical protein